MVSVQWPAVCGNPWGASQLARSRDSAPMRFLQCLRLDCSCPYSSANPSISSSDKPRVAFVALTPSATAGQTLALAGESDTQNL